MAATLDQISGGRIDLNVVPGGIQGRFRALRRNQRPRQQVRTRRGVHSRPSRSLAKARPGGLRRQVHQPARRPCLARRRERRAEVLSGRRVRPRPRPRWQAVRHLPRLDTPPGPDSRAHRQGQRQVRRRRTRRRLRTQDSHHRQRHGGRGVGRRRGPAFRGRVSSARPAKFRFRGHLDGRPARPGPRRPRPTR